MPRMTEHNTNFNRGLLASTGFKAAGAFRFPGEWQAVAQQLSGLSIIYRLLPSGNS